VNLGLHVVYGVRRFDLLRGRVPIDAIPHHEHGLDIVDGVRRFDLLRGRVPIDAIPHHEHGGCCP